VNALEEMLTEVLTVGLPAIGHWSTSIPGSPLPTITVDEDDDEVEYEITPTLVAEGLVAIVLGEPSDMNLTPHTRCNVRDRFFGRSDKPFELDEADEIIQVALFGEVYWS
jgi:hypothetical protein